MLWSSRHSNKLCLVGKTTPTLALHHLCVIILYGANFFADHISGTVTFAPVVSSLRSSHEQRERAGKLFITPSPSSSSSSSSSSSPQLHNYSVPFPAVFKTEELFSLLMLLATFQNPPFLNQNLIHSIGNVTLVYIEIMQQKCNSFRRITSNFTAEILWLI